MTSYVGKYMAATRAWPDCCCETGSIEDMKWENVQVGQVLQVKDDELFPADLLCLYTALADKASVLSY